MAWFSNKNNAKSVRFQKLAPQVDDRRTEDLWLPLRKAFDEILQKRSTSQNFEQLYRCAYAMVLRNEGERLYKGLREAIKEHLVKKVRPLVLAEVGDDCLRTINQAWEDYQTSMGMIGDIVIYLDHAYVPKNDVDSVRNLGVLLFLDEVVHYDVVRDHLRDAMLGLVKTEREGIPVDRALLKKACAMLVVLGLGLRSVYEEDFEKPFLDESAQFYALRGQRYIGTKDCLEYIAQVEQHINEESQRAKRCLDKSTVVAVLHVVEKELIWKHMKAIVDMDSGVEYMLKNQTMDDLARLYWFLKRVPDGAKTLLNCVSKHLRSTGKSVVNEHGDSVSLIPQVMELRDRFDHILQRCFNNEELARDMITTNFECILSNTRKSPEYLSAFVDDMMRKGIRNMTKGETEQLLDKVMAIFRSLQEKDLFERYYKQHLAKRLLLNKSASDEVERKIVAKLRNECGCLFTSKMDAMFKDMHVSSNTMQQFREAVSSCRVDLHGVDLSVRVLTTGFWPLAAATQQIRIPVAPWSAYQVFQRFYLAKHNGRQLTLQPHLGWADMSAVFYGPAENEPSTSQAASTSSGKVQPRTYVIQVTTYQMCVLMLFNRYDAISCQDIASETNIPETSLVRALNSMCMGKASEPLLTKTPATNEIENDHIFAVNEAFTSGLQKVKIESTSSKKIAALKKDEPVVNLDEDRRYELEAAIVRIMKARKTLLYEDLLVEVTKSLQTRYTPSPAAFRKRVDALVEREYLEKASEDPEVYNYIP
ncbi:cullin-3-like [Rhipicephalus microplus]|uniref:cullin-3-like n=1 Tax=Rhipicephalus microplus TaxID=6941 RepID=UPI003F6B5ED8